MILFFTHPLPKYRYKIRLFLGKLVTLNERPFLFGGVGGAVYKWEEEAWHNVGVTTLERQHQLVVAVEETWLCNGTAPPTTPSSLGLDCPTEGDCRAEDGRGVAWLAQFGEWAEQPCSESTGTARWYCDQCTAEFRGEQPDRTECVAGWLAALPDQLADPAVPALQISADIAAKTAPAAPGHPGLTGGSLLSLTDQLEPLLAKYREEEDGAGGGAAQLAADLLHAASALLTLEVGWTEVSSEVDRYSASSRILTALDSLGLVVAGEAGPGCNADQQFNTDNIELGVVVATSPAQCFTFSGGTVCLPDEPSNPSDCNTMVASSLTVPGAAPVFPSSGSVTLQPGLLSATLNNASTTAAAGPVTIRFEHAARPTGAGPSCVWWEESSLAWEERGCSYSEADSSSYTTVCHCDHLTNFGIMFDYSGEADPDDPLLSGLSIALLCLSCLALLATQALLTWIK